jgi:hypothetical protein
MVRSDRTMLVFEVARVWLPSRFDDVARRQLGPRSNATKQTSSHFGGCSAVDVAEAAADAHPLRGKARARGEALIAGTGNIHLVGRAPSPDPSTLQAPSAPPEHRGKRSSCKEAWRILNDGAAAARHVRRSFHKSSWGDHFAAVLPPLTAWIAGKGLKCVPAF